jgi:hypothetical protein
MRSMTVVCDVCKKTVDDFNGGVTLAAGWGETIRADACSVKCVITVLKGFAVKLEAQGDRVASDNASFVKDHPEATPAGPSVTIGAGPGWDTKKWGTFGPPPATTAPVSKGTHDEPSADPVPVAPTPLESQPSLTGCAACDAGTPMNADTAFKHTGEGALCQGKSPTAAESGPCSCEPTNWKMEHPPEVVCQRCGNMWTAKIKQENMPGTGKGKGRPKGSKNRKTLEAEAAAAAAAGATATTNGTTPAIPAETPENKVARDVSLGRTPEPHVDEMARLKASRATNGQVPVAVNSSATLPGENVSQLVTDAAKLGVMLNLVDVMKWTSMQRDLLRGWVSNPEFDPPEFLSSMGYGPVKTAPVQMPPMQPIQVPAAPAVPAASAPVAAPRFTF